MIAMQKMRRWLLVILILTIITLTILYTKLSYRNKEITNEQNKWNNSEVIQEDYNVWFIFTKVYEGSPLKFKFIDLVNNLMNVTSVPLTFNIIIDNSSEQIAKKIIVKEMTKLNKTFVYNLYHIDNCAKLMKDIVEVMTMYFSKPGSYYSDVLFYLSLGLHRIAPKSQKYAILLDCDIFFKKDIALLFREFQSFKETALFGLAPELSPVYRHVLLVHRTKNNSSKLGDYYHWNQTPNSSVKHSLGFQGYNSGVVLFKLDSIRNSKEYGELLQKSMLDKLTKKYDFKQGHLGDQDFYTLVGCEYPHLIQTLKCGYNKQLCTWWRDNGYRDVFDHYARCDHDIVVLHGNCNTNIPK